MDDSTIPVAKQKRRQANHRIIEQLRRERDEVAELVHLRDGEVNFLRQDWAKASDRIADLEQSLRSEKRFGLLWLYFFAASAALNILIIIFR